MWLIQKKFSFLGFWAFLTSGRIEGFQAISGTSRYNLALSGTFKAKGKQKGQTKRGKPSQFFFADFRWLFQFADFRSSWELQLFGGADSRRRPQETEIFAENHLVCPF